MPIPDRLLPHTVVITKPARVSDHYANPGQLDYATGTTTTTTAWLQEGQYTAGEDTNGRDALISQWTMITNYQGIEGYDRVAWDGKTFEVDGQPSPKYTPLGLHHVEATLRHVQG